MADPQSGVVPVSVSPSTRIVSVTPDDDNDLPNGRCRALLVGTGGSADIIDGEENSVSGVPLQTGYNPISVRRVKLTNLTASTIFALY